MTRLTNDQRVTIVNAVRRAAEDDTLNDKLQAQVRKDELAALPAVVREAYEERPDLFKVVWNWTLKIYNLGTGTDYKPSAAAQRLIDARRANTTAADAVVNEVRQALAGLTTHKQVAERYPELARFLPAATPKTANLPAVVDTGLQAKLKELLK